MLVVGCLFKNSVFLPNIMRCTFHESLNQLIGLRLDLGAGRCRTRFRRVRGQHLGKQTAYKRTDQRRKMSHCVPRKKNRNREKKTNGKRHYFDCFFVAVAKKIVGSARTTSSFRSVTTWRKKTHNGETEGKGRQSACR